MSYLLDPEGEFVIDSRRDTSHVLLTYPPADRAEVHAEQRRHRRITADVAIGALAIFLAWVLGQVFIGEPALIDEPTPAVYVHPEPITD